MSIRLNKLLAQRGVGARRKCDALIAEGAVQVNGRVVTEPGTQVEPERDRVTVRGRPLAPPAPHRYFVLNKPVGVITTLEDPEGRRTIRDFMPAGARLFPVGRLDADTSGLLILTNDGELAHHLMHPRYGVTKEYRVRLDQAPGPGALRLLRGGVEFEPGVRSAPAEVRVLSAEPGDALIQVTLHEGRYRQVRRMCEAVGLQVRALHRSAYGPLRLGPVQRGVWRELSEEEVARLRAACARPVRHGQVGYRSPRAHGDVRRRLERRLRGPGTALPGAGAPPGAADERRARPRREDTGSRPGRPRREDAGSRPGRPGRENAGARRARPGREDAGARRGRPAIRPRGADAMGGRRGERAGAPEAGREGRRPRPRRGWSGQEADGRAGARRGTARGRPERRQRPEGAPRGRSGGPRGAGQNPRRAGRTGATGRPPRRPRGRRAR